MTNTAPAPGRHRDPTGAFTSPFSALRERQRLEKRRVASLAVAVTAGTLITVFGVTSLLEPTGRGWPAVLVGMVTVAVATLVLVLDPPRRPSVARRPGKRRASQR